MEAYHGKQEIKDYYIARVRKHRELDQLAQGCTWDAKTQRGCAVGCTLHKYSHTAYEDELGIPRVLARIQDGIFEGLDVSVAVAWPESFLGAIRLGADLSLVWPKFAVWLLSDAEHGVIKFARSECSKQAIARVTELYRRWADGAKPSTDEFAAAAADAGEAADAAYAAYAAADAAYAAADAAYAADDAGEAAAAAAAAAYAADDYAYASSAAAAAADVSAARSKARLIQSERLLALLSEA